MSGLYIHIPFCHGKCAYCDFYSMPSRGDMYGRYVGALLDEFDTRHSLSYGAYDTLYIGGGTPSMLPAQLMTRLITGLAERGVDITSLREFTVEANPEDVTHQWLSAMAAAGVGRVSMGIQSFDDNELAAIGRRHSAQQAMEAAGMLRDSGLTFSLDLIYGLPGQTPDSWRRSLDTLISLHPHHLSAYLLSYEPGTRLHAMLMSGRVAEASEDTVGQMYDTLISTAHDAGYRHYEISNFGLPGYEAIHNSRYWDGTPYLGLGASAHSFDGKKRYVNVSNIRRYIGHEPPVTENESATDRLNDYIVTALRTSHGIDTEYVMKEWGTHALNRMMDDAAPVIRAGNLIVSDGHLIIPEQHWLIADNIMRCLIQVDA